MAKQLMTGKLEARGGAAGAQADYHPQSEFFAHPAEPFGSHELSLSVAGMSARLTGLSARQQADLAARYGVFARSEPGDKADIAISVQRSPRASFLAIRRGGSPETYRLLTRQEGETLMAWSYDWAGHCVFGERRGSLAAGSEDRVVFDRTVENFLRVAFAHLALRKGSLLLHGAAVVRGGRAFVFFGPSGSGKTTVTLLSKGDLVLSDDLVMIVPAGAGQSYEAASVPFRGLLTPQATSNRRYPIAGLFKLVQDSRDFLEEVGRPQGVGEVVQSLPFVTERPEAAESILEIVGALTRATPVRRLHFRKDPAFWEVIESV